MSTIHKEYEENEWVYFLKQHILKVLYHKYYPQKFFIVSELWKFSEAFSVYQMSENKVF